MWIIDILNSQNTSIYIKYSIGFVIGSQVLGLLLLLLHYITNGLKNIRNDIANSQVLLSHEKNDMIVEKEGENLNNSVIKVKIIKKTD